MGAGVGAWDECEHKGMGDSTTKEGRLMGTPNSCLLWRKPNYVHALHAPRAPMHNRKPLLLLHRALGVYQSGSNSLFAASKSHQGVLPIWGISQGSVSTKGVV